MPACQTWCNLNLKIISSGSRTRDFTVDSRYNYRYAAKVLHQALDASLAEWLDTYVSNLAPRVRFPKSKIWRYVFSGFHQDVIFWVGPEQGGFGTQKARGIISSHTISLLNQCMCLNDDLRQVTIQDMSQAIAHLGCSTIAEVQAKLQRCGEDWKQHPSLCHRFLACTSRGMQIEWTAIHIGPYVFWKEPNV